MAEELRLAQEIERGIMVRVRVKVVDPKVWQQLIQAPLVKFRYADFINRIVEFDIERSIVSERTLREGLRLGYFKVVFKY